MKFSLTFLIVFTCGLGGMAASPREGSRYLENEVLRVEVMDPSHPQRYHRGTRFSSVANVLQVERGGKTYLFSPDQHDPIKDNGGLASEFDLLAETPPPGFPEAKEGGEFLKIGVGILRKINHEYLFWLQYPLVESAKTRVKWRRDRATFVQTCRVRDGHAYRLQAEVRLLGEVLEIHYRLSNTGRKTIVTEQYAHNFFQFSGQAPGPGYSMEAPAAFAVEDWSNARRGGLRRQGNAFRFTRPLAAPVNIILRRTSEGSDAVTLTNTRVGQSLRVSTHPASHWMLVHSDQRYICPEQFLRITLPPGKTKTWTRRYEFLATEDAPGV